MLGGGRRQYAARQIRATAAGLLALLPFILAALVGAPSASAHAELLGTMPQADAVLERLPTAAVLRFNEDVKITTGGIRLFPGRARPIVLDARITDTKVIARLPEGLPGGRYTLTYRVVSADGHPVSGSVDFTVGKVTAAAAAPLTQIVTGTPGTTRVALSVLTSLQYLGLLIFAGLVFFERIVRRGDRRLTGRVRVVLAAAGSVAAMASMLLIAVSALNITGDDLGSIMRPVVWWPDVLFSPVLVAAIVLVGTGVGAMAAAGGGHGAPRVVAVLCSLAALLTPVLVGHSRLVEPRVVMIAADLGHLVVGGFWVGGVVGLLILLTETKPAGGGIATDTDRLAVVEVVLRFSRYALGSVLLLAISGTVMGLMIIDSFEQIVTIGYGRTLLLKLGIVGAVIAIAAYNRRRLLPALLARPTMAMMWTRLAHTLAYEAALLACVLAVTGVLTNQSPNADGAVKAKTIAVQGSAQRLFVTGTLTQARTGEHTLAFSLRYEGRPARPEKVVVRTRLPKSDLGPFEIAPRLDAATGRYTATLRLPDVGDWEIRILARVSIFAEPIVTIPVTID